MHVSVPAFVARAGRAGRVGPWFRRRPALAVAVAVALFVGVFGLRLAVHGTAEGISLLFVLPISLLAVSFGARAGTLAGGAAMVLLGAWVVASDASLSPLGWLTRAIPLVLLGPLVGAAADRLRDAAQAQQRLVVASERAREAAEINDSIIQGLVAAKWSLEAGGTERSIDLLTESIQAAQALVTELLSDQADPMAATQISQTSRSQEHDHDDRHPRPDPR